MSQPVHKQGSVVDKTIEVPSSKSVKFELLIVKFEISEAIAMQTETLCSYERFAMYYEHTVNMTFKFNNYNCNNQQG